MSAHQLRVDWPACRGRGICHELAPELVDLDPWGYPIVSETAVEEYRDAARAAVAACPRQALQLLPKSSPLGPKASTR